MLKYIELVGNYYNLPEGWYKIKRKHSLTIQKGIAFMLIREFVKVQRKDQRRHKYKYTQKPFYSLIARELGLTYNNVVTGMDVARDAVDTYKGIKQDYHNLRESCKEI